MYVVVFGFVITFNTKFSFALPRVEVIIFNRCYINLVPSSRLININCHILDFFSFGLKSYSVSNAMGWDPSYTLSTAAEEMTYQSASFTN